GLVDGGQHRALRSRYALTALQIFPDPFLVALARLRRLGGDLGLELRPLAARRMRRAVGRRFDLSLLGSSLLLCLVGALERAEIAPDADRPRLRRLGRQPRGSLFLLLRLPGAHRQLGLLPLPRPLLLPLRAPLGQPLIGDRRCCRYQCWCWCWCRCRFDSGRHLRCSYRLHDRLPRLQLGGARARGGGGALPFGSLLLLESLLLGGALGGGLIGALDQLVLGKNPSAGGHRGLGGSSRRRSLRGHLPRLGLWGARRLDSTSFQSGIKRSIASLASRRWSDRRRRCRCWFASCW